MTKATVHSAVLTIIQEKLHGIQLEFDALQESLTSETKSTAGDKHETGRAMTQLEQEKLSRQLGELRKTQEGLHRIDPTATIDPIGFGSLIETSRGWFYISVGIGAVNVDGQSVFCITAGSPMGQKMLGKTSGDQFDLNGAVTIEFVC